MTNTAKLAHQMERGDQARALLNHPLIVEFFDKAETETLSAWKTSRVDEKEQREDAWFLFQAIQRLRSCFRQTIAEGEFAAKELRRIQESENAERDSGDGRQAGR